MKRESQPEMTNRRIKHTVSRFCRPKVIDLAKTELEDMGESTEGMVESTATLREEIMALSGVDIMLNDQ